MTLLQVDTTTAKFSALQINAVRKKLLKLLDAFKS